MAFCKVLRAETATLLDFAIDPLRNSVYICGDFSPAHFRAPE